MADAAHSGGYRPRPLKQLLGLIRPDARDIGVVVAFSVVVGVLSLAVPLAAQLLFNYVAFGSLVQPLVVIGVTLFAALAFAAMIRAMIIYVIELLQRRLFVRVVSELGDRLPRARADAFDGLHGPELVNRFFDVLTVQKAGGMLLLDGVAAFLQTVIGLTIVAFYHPTLLAFSITLVILGAAVLLGLSGPAVKTAIAESNAKYKVAATLEEIVGGLNTFKQVDLHGVAFRRADAAATEYVTARRRHFGYFFRQLLGALWLQVVAATALLTIGGYLVILGQLTLGQLVASELIVALALASFTKIAIKLGDIYDMFAAVYKLTTLLELPVERSDGAPLVRATGGAALAFRGVSFGFDPMNDVLREVDFGVGPGERAAIIGAHGSGKSTLAALMLSTRMPTRGRLELDGVDFREMRLDAIREQVVVVKSLEFIDGSIEDNVILGRSAISHEDCRTALEAVGLIDEIRDLPAGLTQRLTALGSPLSSGQKQRLMIARALAGRPRVLVIDDLLDDMDSDARRRVMRTLTDPALSCTVLVLSHHEWAAPHMDRVFRLSRDGVMIEDHGAPARGVAKGEEVDA